MCLDWVFIIKKCRPFAGKGRGRKSVMSDREVKGKQNKEEEWAAERATAFPFPGNLSLTLSASSVRV